MTSKKVPKTCDFCAQDIKSEMAYSLQISQRPAVYVKGVIIKSENNPDMCHPCFLKICTNGYKADWTKIVKNPQTDKWDVVEPQTKLNE